MREAALRDGAGVCDFAITLVIIYFIYWSGGLDNSRFVFATLAGPGAFFAAFLTDAVAMARAHVAALGGNGLLDFLLLPRESTGVEYRNQVRL